MFRKRAWLPSLLLLGLALHACTSGFDPGPAPVLQPSLFPEPARTPLPSLTPIPGPGLEGSWEDPSTATVHTIAWDGSGYRVESSISAERGRYPVTRQQWDGTSLSWTYLVLSTGVSVTFQTISVTGDELATNWSSTNGSSGGETLERVPGPPALAIPLTPTAGNGAEPIRGLAGNWRDDEEGNVHSIQWNGSGYHVISSTNDENGAYEITQEHWDGSALTWTYHVTRTEISVTIQTAVVDGDTLYLNWWSTNGNSSTDSFTRVP